MPNLKDYYNMIEDRPRKFDAAEVEYRNADSKERCGRCVHFFTRKLDNFAVCEIFRSDETDEDGIDPDYVCNFFTHDGSNFPLLKEEANAKD